MQFRVCRCGSCITVNKLSKNELRVLVSECGMITRVYLRNEIVWEGDVVDYNRWVFSLMTDVLSEKPENVEVAVRAAFTELELGVVV